MRFFIVFVLVFQLFVMQAILFDPLHGPHDNAYRHTERWSAYRNWIQNPSQGTKAEYDEEIGRLNSYLRTRDAVIVLFLGIEAVGVYYLWNRKKKT